MVNFPIKPLQLFGCINTMFLKPKFFKNKCCRPQFEQISNIPTSPSQQTFYKATEGKNRQECLGIKENKNKKVIMEV